MIRNTSLLICIFVGFLIHFSCNEPITGPQVSSGPAPPDFYLKQNFPNPFKDTTTIEYGVPITGGSNSLVTIKVYDQFQQEIRTLVNNRYHPAGSNFLTKWNGQDVKAVSVPSGLYIIEMRGYTPQTSILRITAIKK